MDIARLCYPEVTCIDQNVKFLAETCTDTVLGLIEDKERVPQKQIIGVEFHQGQTTYPVELNGIF